MWFVSSCLFLQHKSRVGRTSPTSAVASQLMEIRAVPSFSLTSLKRSVERSDTLSPCYTAFFSSLLSCSFYSSFVPCCWSSRKSKSSVISLEDLSWYKSKKNKQVFVIKLKFILHSFAFFCLETLQIASLSLFLERTIWFFLVHKLSFSSIFTVTFVIFRLFDIYHFLTIITFKASLPTFSQGFYLIRHCNPYR